MSTSETIFDSDGSLDPDEVGYEVAVAFGPNGELTSVAILDHDRSDIVEMTPSVALQIARAIIDKVRDPAATLN